MLPFASLGPLNRASHFLSINGGQFLFRKTLQEWRSENLGLPRRKGISRHRADTLYAYSEHVLPKPADWGAEICVSGYWFLDNPAYVPTDELSQFLASGAPPVYVGFGSMPGLDPRKTTTVFVDALTMRSERVIIATGGGALTRVPAPPTVLFIEGAPHDWLFPHMRAIIHHGGAGTTGAALRAGKPSIICPFFGDQPFWGRLIEGLVVGAILDRKRLSPGTIGKALALLDDEAVAERASAIGTLIGSENGTSAAADFLERRLEGRLIQG